MTKSLLKTTMLLLLLRTKPVVKSKEVKPLLLLFLLPRESSLTKEINVLLLRTKPVVTSSNSWRRRTRKVAKEDLWLNLSQSLSK
jgi:hypothetical protein